MADESATPDNDDRPRRCLWRHIHKAQNGRKASIVGFARAPTPQSRPKIIQWRHSRDSSSSSERSKMSDRIRGVNVVSQIPRTDQYQMYGRKAHVRADHSAT